MQVVEFTNQFHISIDFGRWKDRDTEMVKSFKNPDGTTVARWEFKKKVWVFPIEYKAQVYEIGRKCKATLIQINDSLPEKVDVIPQLPKLSFNIPLKTDHGAMREYQEMGVARGLELKRFINGDQPGLGKTLQSIATVYGAEKRGEITFPALVISPSGLKINWSREFEMWTDKKTMIIDDKNKDTWHRFYEMGVADVFIVNFESLKKYFVKSMPPKKKLEHSSQIIMDPRIEILKSVIIDESHRLKNPDSITAKICINLTRGKLYIILLTGTPVVNKPLDLYSQLAIIYKLKKFGGPDGFKQRYCEGGRGSSNLQELNYLLNVNCFFRREKQEVLKDLPDKVRQTIICSITNREEFNKVKNDFANYLKSTELGDKEIAKKLGSEVIVKITLLLQLAAKGKIEAAKEYIEEITESGQKIVVFCKHKEIVAMLMREFPKAVKVTGDDDAEAKQFSVDEFQNNPNVNIIICNHKAAGVGLTLTASSEVLFVEFPWTYADCEQCEDRCHRFGQKNNVRATYLLGENTLDQWLYDIIQEKKRIANAVTGTEDTVENSFIDSVFNLFK